MKVSPDWIETTPPMVKYLPIVPVSVTCPVRSLFCASASAINVPPTGCIMPSRSILTVNEPFVFVSQLK